MKAQEHDDDSDEDLFDEFDDDASDSEDKFEEQVMYWVSMLTPQHPPHEIIQATEEIVSDNMSNYSQS